MEDKKITVKVSFYTLTGLKTLLWTLEEAMTSEFAGNVKSLLADRAAVGCSIQHQFYGKVNLAILGREL